MLTRLPVILLSEGKNNSFIVENTDEENEGSTGSLVEEEVPESSVVNESAPADNYSYSIIVPDKDIHSDFAVASDDTVEYEDSCTYRIGGVDYTGNPGVPIEDGEIVTIQAALRYNGGAFSSWENLPSDSDKEVDGNVISFKFKKGEVLPIPVYQPAYVVTLPSLAEGFEVEYFDVDGNLKRPGDEITVLPKDEIAIQIRTPDNIKDAKFLNPGAGFFNREKKLKAGEWQEFSFKISENGQIDISIEVE